MAINNTMLGGLEMPQARRLVKRGIGVAIQSNNRSRKEASNQLQILRSEREGYALTQT